MVLFDHSNRRTLETNGSTTEKARQIEAEQIKLFYSHARTAAIATLFNAAIVTAVLWKIVPLPRLLTWFMFAAVVAAARQLVARRYDQAAPAPEQAPLWRRRLLLATGATGLMWGVAAIVLFVPDSFAHQAFLAILLCGTTAGAIATLTPFLSAFAIFLFPIATPMTVQFFRQGELLPVMLGVLTFSFSGVLFATARQWYVSATETLFLRFDKQELLTHLQRRTAELTQTEDALRIINNELDQRVQERTEALLQANQALQHEIAEHQRTEAERQQLQQQLFHSEKLKAVGTLAGGIAHEFNNILTAIIGFSDLLTREIPQGTGARAKLEEVLKGGHRAKDLVRQLLDFSRPQEDNRRPIALRPVIADSLQLLRALLPATTEIQSHFAVDGDMILGDSTQLHQVMMNLGINAQHAIAVKQGVLTVSLDKIALDASSLAPHPELSPGQYLRLTVRDTGCGMEPAIVARIFEPFFTTKDIGEGSGLGLAVVHGVIHNHGGAIAVTSTPGQGSTFTIYLPSLGAVFTPAATAEAPECSGSGQILIVDDEQAVATLLQQLLEDLGYVVVATTSSTAALSMVEQQPERFDAVITDQTMPELTGEQLARQLLTLRPELPIIVSTGFSSTLTKERAEELGIQGYLTKPFSRAQVGTLLQEVLTAKSTTAL